jgi:hypothetical protein
MARAEKGLPITVNIPPGWKKVKAGPDPSRPGKTVYRYEVDNKERELLEEIATRRDAGESYEKISNDLFFKGVYRHNAPSKRKWNRKHGQAGLYSPWFLTLAMKCRERGYPLLTRKKLDSQDPALSS